MGKWVNADGLIVKLGTTEAEVVRGGEINSKGSMREWEFNLDLTTLGSSSALLADTAGILLPDGLFIDEVVVITEEVADSAADTATLTLGLIRQDQSTTYDVDGLLAVVTQASMSSIGETVVYRDGVALTGDLVGTELANTGFLVGNYGTEAFTAGEIRVIIRGHVPRPAASI